MKSEGFLDEIEKIVDDAWDIEKNEINTHVDREKKGLDEWYSDAVQREQERHVREYQREYLQAINERTRWDTPFAREHLSTFPRPTRTIKHKCDCRLELEVSCLVGPEPFTDYAGYRAFGREYSEPVIRREEYDRFFCPRCRSQINVIGKVMEIKVNMAE